MYFSCLGFNIIPGLIHITVSFLCLVTFGISEFAFAFFLPVISTIFWLGYEIKHNSYFVWWMVLGGGIVILLLIGSGFLLNYLDKKDKDEILTEIDYE